VLAYERREGDERIVIALNLGAEAHVVDLPAGELLLTTGEDYAPGRLGPNQGVMLRVSA
jgi:hypothetical protein